MGDLFSKLRAGANCRRLRYFAHSRAIPRACAFCALPPRKRHILREPILSRARMSERTRISLVPSSTSADQLSGVAGGIVLASVALGLLFNPYRFGLTAYVGGGLVFAGITGKCPMAT